MKKNKYLLFLYAFAVLLLSSGGFISALEVNLPGLKNNASLADYVSYIFTFLISCAAGIAAISFTVGAIQLIASGVSGDSAAGGDAKDRMKGAILGLVLTLASFLILQTINPKLVSPTSTPLSGVAGIFYTNGSQFKACPQENPDSSTIPAGFSTIKYCCNAACNGGTGPKLLVWQYTQKNYGDLASANVSEISCSGTSGVGQSFVMSFETPGVYYCLGGCAGNICTGMSGVNTSSQDTIADQFAGKIKSVAFITDGSDWGAIFHKEKNLSHGGQCTQPITSSGGQKCLPVNSADTFAVDIFMLNNSLGASGDGVNFYSKPHGWDSGQSAGYANIKDSDINSPFLQTDADSNDMTYQWNGVDATQEYQDSCQTFKDCPGSIEIKGTYLVGLYSANNYCQTFSADVPNLKAQPITAAGGELSSVDIIPVGSGSFSGQGGNMGGAGGSGSY